MAQAKPIIGIVRPTRIFVVEDTSWKSLDDVSSSSLSNAKSSAATPDDSPRAQIQAPKKTISEHRYNSKASHNDGDTSETLPYPKEFTQTLAEKLKHIKGKNNKKSSIILEENLDSSSSYSTSYSVERGIIETPVFLTSGAKTDRPIITVNNIPLQPDHHSAPVSTRNGHDKIKIPICPQCASNDYVVLLGYWKERQQAVYYCGNIKSPTIRGTTNQTKEIVDDYSHDVHGFKSPLIAETSILEKEEDEEKTMNTDTNDSVTPKKRNRLFSLFRSTTPSPSKSQHNSDLKKSKSAEYKSNVPTKSDQPFQTCSYIWMPNLIYQHIERIIIKYSPVEKKMISYFE